MPKKHKAIFTQIHNEPDFFPIWLKYYSQFFDADSIFVLHLLKPKRVPFDDWLTEQASQPGGGGFVHLPVPDVQICDFQLVVDRAKILQRELLGRYEAVLFAEVDEFVAHPDGLGDYIDRWIATPSPPGRQVEVCNGYEVVHQFDGDSPESPIDLSRPILPQRRSWYHAHLYDKALLSRVPLNWGWGFHHTSDQFPWATTDLSLLLIHLNKVDYDLCVRRRLARIQNEDDSQLVKEHPVGSPGWDLWISEFELRGWFKISVDDQKPAPFEAIPEWVAKQIPL